MKILVCSPLFLFGIWVILTFWDNYRVFLPCHLWKNLHGFHTIYPSNTWQYQLVATSRCEVFSMKDFVKISISIVDMRLLMLYVFFLVSPQVVWIFQGVSPSYLNDRTYSLKLFVTFTYYPLINVKSMLFLIPYVGFLVPEFSLLGSFHY